jgi:hypothetical protein
MFDLWRLKRAERKAWDKFIAHAQPVLEGRKELPKDLKPELLHNYELAEFKVELFQSRSLVSQAESLDIVLPPDSDGGSWKTNKLYTHPFLTPKGRYQVRKFIDAEKARRFEVRTLWVTKIVLPLAGVLVGIIGALTGLVAVLQHKR